MNRTELTHNINKMIALSGRMSKLMGLIKETIGSVNEFARDEKELDNLQELITFYTKVLYIFIILGAMGLGFNVILYWLINKGVNQRKLSPKRYALIKSRIVSDGLTSMLTVVWAMLDISIFGFTNIINIIHVVQLSLSFWSVTGSSLALAVITFLAAKHPLYYRTKITTKRCMCTVTLIWVLSLAITTGLAPIGGSVFFSHISEYCSHTCQLGILAAVIVIFVGSFCCVPILYITILLTLCRRSTQCHTCAAVNQLQVNNYWRLGLSILSYTIFNSPFLLLSCAAALLLSHSEAPDDERNLTRQIFVLRLLASLIVCARTVVDPLLTAALDYTNLKATFFNQPGIRSTYRDTTYNEETIRMIPRSSKQGRQKLSMGSPKKKRSAEPYIKQAISISVLPKESPKMVTYKGKNVSIQMRHKLSAGIEQQVRAISVAAMETTRSSGPP